MKIYKVWQDDVCGYDTYDSAVIIAEGINRAKRLSIEKLGRGGGLSKTWTDDISKVHATEIGISNKDEEDIVVASFNAG